jgi:hypothetical protein
MDWLQFISAIVGHLAWPLVFIILFIILRKHLGSMADRLLELSFGGAKVTFDKILREGAAIIIDHAPAALAVPTDEPELKLGPPAGEGVPAEAPKRVPGKRPPIQIGTGIFGTDWANSSPGQILNAYERVEESLRYIGRMLGTESLTPPMIMYALKEMGLLDMDFVELFGKLREARDLIAHAKTIPDQRETVEFVRQAAYLERVLGEVKHKVKAKLF